MPLLSDRVVLALATAGGAGRAPRGPGTAGTLVALGIHVGMVLGGAVHPAWGAVLALLAASVSIAITPRACRVLGDDDPGSFVLDEVAGYWVAATLAGWSMPAWAFAACFLVFRAADISKVPPVGALERVRSPWGVTLDDLAAGALAGGAVALARYVLA